MPKATKAQKASKDSRLVKPNPFTPVRRLFFKLDRFRPGNRHRAQHQEPSRHGNPEPDPVVDTPPEKPGVRNTSPTSPHPHAAVTHGRACVALQNDDLTENAVVITALSTLPFCCHEDLLTMPRSALIGVAESLNAKLPAVLHISSNRACTDAAIRNEIEFVVGLRTEMEVPPAPRAQRPRLEDGGYVPEVDANEEMDRTPPTSPLARRGRRLFQIYGTPGTPRLERLAEEEEEEEDRPTKRQRTRSTIQEADDSMDVDVAATPTPLPTRPRVRGLRSRSEQMPSPPTPTRRARVLRSHSTKLPAEMANRVVDPTFINTKRPKWRKRENIEVGGSRRASQPAPFRKTTTPRQKPRAASTTAACRPFLALREESTSMSSLTSQSSAEMSPASSDSYRVGMKRRRNSIEAETGMAFGINGMSMRSSAGGGIEEMDMMH